MAESDDPARSDDASLIEGLDAVVWQARPEDLCYIRVGGGAEQLLGFPHARWLLEPMFLQQQIHPHDRDGAVAAYRRAARGADAPQTIEFRAQRADGRWIWLRDRFALRPPRPDAPAVLHGVLLEITDHRRLERLQRDQVALLKQMSTGAPLRETLDALARMVEHDVSDGLCSILLLDADGRHVRHGAAPSLPQGFVEAVDGQPIGARAGSCGTAAFEQREVIASDIANDPLWDAYRALAKRYGLAACWSIPIRSAAHAVLGTFALYFTRPRTPLAEELALLRDCSHLASVAIERTRIEHALRERQQRLTEMAENIDELFYNFDRDQHRLVYVSAAYTRISGRPVETLYADPKVYKSMVVEADRTRVDEATRADRYDQPREIEYRIRRADGAIRWVRDRSFPMRDDRGRVRRVVGTVQDITEHKALLRNLRRALRAQRMLTDCNQALVRADCEQALIAAICRIIVDIGGYRMAWVGEALDDREKTVRPLGHAGSEDGYLAAIRVSWSAGDPRGAGPAGRAIRSGRAEIVPDIHDDPDFAPWRTSAAAHQFAGVTCFPLRDGEHSFGVLVLYQSEPLDLKTDEMKLLQELADDLAFGILNLRARAEQQRIYETVMKVAEALSDREEGTRFERLLNSLADATQADAAVVALMDGQQPGFAIPRAVMIDGQPGATDPYRLDDAPCRNLRHETRAVVFEAAAQFPRSRLIGKLEADTYIGHRLERPGGAHLGQLFVLFRRRPTQPELVASLLKVFATRINSLLQAQASGDQIRRQAALLDHSRDAIMLTDLEDRIIFWNRGAEVMFGWSAQDAAGRGCAALFDLPHDVYLAARRKLFETGHWEGELDKRARDGQRITVAARHSLVTEADGRSGGILHICTDVTERKRDQARIEYLAYYDALTGLPNRVMLMQWLEQSVERARRGGGRLAVLFLDLNRFKEINDIYGHLAGDQALAEVARRLRSCLRSNEMLARVSGDEFIVVLEDGERDAAAQVIQRLEQALSHPLRVQRVALHLGTSIGVAIYPEDGTDAGTLLNHSDIAMYSAKHDTGGHLFYHPGLASRHAKRIEIARRLEIALQEDRLDLHYQPLVDLSSGALIGTEALLRWEEPEWGAISPAEFIPIAEERRMMNALGDWVLRRACRQLVQWLAAGLFPPRMAVNIAAEQIERPGFAAHADRLVRDLGLQPSMIELELTERQLMKDATPATEVVRSLVAHGFTFSIDDFGSGYSSLAYLQRFAVEKLKIDIAFVREMLTNRNDFIIVRTIVSMAESLGLTTLAEGVETAEQAAALAQMGCRQAQGYHFDRPLPPDQLARKWLRRGDPPIS